SEGAGGGREQDARRRLKGRSGRLERKNNAAKKEESETANKNDSSKKLSVERVYQKKTQLEHILLRPDTYIGSVEPLTQLMWVYDEDIGMNCREVTFVPGLYKIFDEILVNAADNKQRDKNMTCIKVSIDPESNIISIWNNGKGIPVVEHKVEKVYVPALIFGQLLTSSNYDDDEKKVTGGRNGYGAKLCNIFSTKFTVETACKEYKHSFKQIWMNNMMKTSEAKIKHFDGEDYTCITFQPDLSKFKMEKLDKDIVALMTRRAYDLAGSCKGVKVMFNGKKLPACGVQPSNWRSRPGDRGDSRKRRDIRTGMGRDGKLWGLKVPGGNPRRAVHECPESSRGDPPNCGGNPGWLSTNGGPVVAVRDGQGPPRE
ncbi:PREDICTED: DNA topoisomerase 2-beta-like, partial [Lipotes vexillifer]|uniref:DNA topoisomerase (ATP-hydrolyzing) n=1 Tax=Lipotes vexillifer TaxID=118797 RepID=A0A340Y6L5_LIPVE